MKLHDYKLWAKKSTLNQKDEKMTTTFHGKMQPKRNQVLLNQNQRNHKQQTKQKCAEKITQINKLYQHITDKMKIVI